MSAIIVSTDFSSTTATALEMAGWFAENTGFEIEVVHFHDGYGKEDVFVSRKGNMSAQIGAQRELEQFIRFNVSPGGGLQNVQEDVIAKIANRCLIGDAAPGLIKLSKTAGTELLIMGASGAGVTHGSNPFYGSVAKAVSLKSDCPVLLVPQKYSFAGFQKIAYSFKNEAPLRAVKDGSDKFFATSTARRVYVHLEHDNPDEERKEIAFLGDPTRLDFMRSDDELKVLEPGELADRLIEFINDEEVDLLVMGRRKRGFVESLFINSEIQPLLRRCKIPLLIVPIEK